MLVQSESRPFARQKLCPLLAAVPDVLDARVVFPPCPQEHTAQDCQGGSGGDRCSQERSDIHSMYVVCPAVSYTWRIAHAWSLAVVGLQEWRRHASTQSTIPFLSSDTGSPYESPHYRLGADLDSKFRVPTHTPLARYNLMLASQLDRGKTHVVFVIARRMKEEGIKPDRTTYNCLLQACAQHQLYQEARGIFEDMVAMGIHPDRQSFHYLMQVSDLYSPFVAPSRVAACRYMQ